MRRALLLPLAIAACSDNSEPKRSQYKAIAAARQGLYAVKAAPGGAIALFSDVRLFGPSTVCGSVDAQDGGGLRRFAVVPGGEPVIEGSGDSAARTKIDTICRGPARKVISRNKGYTDLEIEAEAH